MTDIWNQLPASLWPVQPFIPPDEQTRIIQSALSLGIPLNWSAVAPTAPPPRDLSLLGFASQSARDAFGTSGGTSGNPDTILADNPAAPTAVSTAATNPPAPGLPTSGSGDANTMAASPDEFAEASQRPSLDDAYGNPNIVRQGQRGRAVAATRPPPPDALSDIGPEIYRAGGEALHDINAGLNPSSAERRALYQRSAKAMTPDEALAAHWEGDKLFGRGVVGIPNLIAAPITGLWRSVVGHSLQTANAGLRAAAVGVLGEDAVRRGEQAAGVGAHTSFEEARQAADSLMPAIAPRTGMPRGPLPPFRPSPPLVREMPFEPSPARSVVGSAANAQEAEQAPTPYAPRPDLEGLELKALERRAHEIHNALKHDIERTQRTTAVLKTDRGWIVAGGKKHDLTPEQQSLLYEYEHAAVLPGEDAEITALVDAENRGWRPRAIATTREICPECETFIKSRGGVRKSPTLYVFPE